jgi:hypothetical protein
MPSKLAEKLKAALEAIEVVQERIDLVAEDFKSGENKYAAIDSWTLGELLEIDFDTAGDSGRTYWGYRARLKDGGHEFPFADNLGLLEGFVSPTRFSELERQAEELRDGENPKDISLSANEQSELEEAYAKEHSSQEGVSTAWGHGLITQRSGVQIPPATNIDGVVRAPVVLTAHGLAVHGSNRWSPSMNAHRTHNAVRWRSAVRDAPCSRWVSGRRARGVAFHLSHATRMSGRRLFK